MHLALTVPIFVHQDFEGFFRSFGSARADTKTTPVWVGLEIAYGL